MCGINGIFAFHPAASAPDEAELLKTRDAMRARGPDGSGVWWSAARRCALAHRRLSILDLSNRASRDQEPAGIIGFHLFGSVPEPFTLYREIRVLPAGHTQWIDAAGPREPKPFANLGAILREGALNPAPVDELLQRVREAALNSTRAHLLSDVEVGVFLSSGGDFGALLGLMRDGGARDIRAITLGFDEFRGMPGDEGPLAGRVSRASCPG